MNDKTAIEMLRRSDMATMHMQIADELVSEVYEYGPQYMRGESLADALKSAQIAKENLSKLINILKKAGA